MIVLLAVIGIACIVLAMLRDYTADDPRDRHPSTGGAMLPQPRHVRLIGPDDVETGEVEL